MTAPASMTGTREPSLLRTRSDTAPMIGPEIIEPIAPTARTTPSEPT
jgi:hypothetical protein